MKIKIYLKENNSFIGDFNIRKNSNKETVIKKIKEYIEKYYNCGIKRILPTGKTNFENGYSDISYVVFGNNLPFRQFYYIIEEDM